MVHFIQTKLPKYLLNNIIFKDYIAARKLCISQSMILPFAADASDFLATYDQVGGLTLLKIKR
jgi:hypothetical protein